MGIAMMDRDTVEDRTAEADRWAYLLHAWQEADAPEGWRAEIREEGIVMVLPPGGVHNSIAYQIQKQIMRVIPDDWGIHQTSGVALPEIERLRIPDLTVVPRAAVSTARHGVPLAADDVALVVEIVSPYSVQDDRVTKKAEYAHAGTPLYVLVDCFTGGGTVTLFGNPRDGSYADSHRVDFGEPITLPEPFDLKLDTSGFRVPHD